jgi:ribonuclease-3
MDDLDERLDRVSAGLGHVFQDRGLLLDALTHRSYAHEKPQLAPRDNERLEFLGDAVAGLAVSTLLFHRFPEAPEGELTRRRADLVCEPSLAAIAGELGLGEALRLGRGEERSGGRTKPRLLASALEACLGAVQLDGGPQVADRVARDLFSERLDQAPPGARDFKSKLQTQVQAAGGGTPQYRVVDTDGPDHERVFRVALELDGTVIGRGEGRSKLEAEQAAAAAALDRPAGEEV